VKRGVDKLRAGAASMLASLIRDAVAAGDAAQRTHLERLFAQLSAPPEITPAPAAAAADDGIALDDGIVKAEAERERQLVERLCVGKTLTQKRVIGVAVRERALREVLNM
jgi:hypothetical protein